MNKLIPFPGNALIKNQTQKEEEKRTLKLSNQLQTQIRNTYTAVNKQQKTIPEDGLTDKLQEDTNRHLVMDAK